jgi:hypothetical protein
MPNFFPQESHEAMQEMDAFKSLSAEHVIVVSDGVPSLFQALLSVFESEMPVDLKHVNPITLPCTSKHSRDMHRYVWLSMSPHTTVVPRKQC